MHVFYIQRSMENYSSILKLTSSANTVFNALTIGIPFWWTEMYDGSSVHEGNSFTVRFGNNVFKTMQIKELVQNIKVVWFVEDSIIDSPELTNQKEWVGTTIVWEMEEMDNGMRLHQLWAMSHGK